MHPPYEPEEVATALVNASQRAGRGVRRVEVIADTLSDQWVVRVEERDGRIRRLTFPFASARGIYTPGELETWLVRGDWPFGG